MTRHKPEPGTPTACRYCGCSVIWAETEHRAPMPCDVLATPQGEFYLFRRPDRIEALHQRSAHKSAGTARQRGDKLYTSHYATCARPGGGSRA